MGNNLWFERKPIINPIYFEIAGGKIVGKTYKSKSALVWLLLQKNWSAQVKARFGFCDIRLILVYLIWCLVVSGNYLVLGYLRQLRRIVSLGSGWVAQFDKAGPIYGEINHCTVEDID